MGQIWDSAPSHQGKHRQPATRLQEQHRGLIQLAITAVILCTVMALAATRPAALVAASYWTVLPVAIAWAGTYITRTVVQAVRR